MNCWKSNKNRPYEPVRIFLEFDKPLKVHLGDKACFMLPNMALRVVMLQFMAFFVAVLLYCLGNFVALSGALTMKGQNIGSSTKKIHKQIFDSNILDNKKQKYMSLGSFKSHTYCSIAKNGSVVVYQNLSIIF